MRLRNIDLFKGILILIVIIGHVIQGTLKESLPRYFIYSFHMPAFIGLSGFLFFNDKVRSGSINSLFAKYKLRVILPWIFAVIGYFIFFCVFTSSFSLTESINSFILPFYHLWFIPAFLSWILSTWLLLKLRMPFTAMLILAAVISIIFFWLKTTEYNFQNRFIDKGFDILAYNFRPQFYLFFVFGAYLKNNVIKMNSTINIVAAILFAILTIYLFYHPNPVVELFSFLCFNLLLVNLLIAVSKDSRLPVSGIIEWIGVNSLPIYLWHVIPLLFVQRLIGVTNSTAFYSVVVLLQVVFLVLVYYMAKVEWINKYLFGNNKSSLAKS